MLDQAFEALKKMDYGTPLSEVAAIDEAVVTAHRDPAVRANLEQRLLAALAEPLSRDAKDYVCRQLALIGTAQSVPGLASLLVDEGNSHLARHALERIPGSEAGAALVKAVDQVQGKLKIGIIASLGVRRETAAVAALAGLLSQADASVVRAAALALGTIGDVASVSALQAAKLDGSLSGVVVDALLNCAERFIGQKQPAVAAGIYRALNTEQHPRLVRLAATRGLLACAAGR